MPNVWFGNMDAWQRHHIVPTQAARLPELKPFLDLGALAGFNIGDFSANGIMLPSSRRDAVLTGLPFHRGGHPRYNDAILDYVRIVARAISGIADRNIAIRAVGDLLFGLVHDVRQRCLDCADIEDAVSINEIDLRGSAAKLSVTIARRGR